MAARYADEEFEIAELEAEARLAFLEAVSEFRGEAWGKFAKNARNRIGQRLDRAIEREEWCISHEARANDSCIQDECGDELGLKQDVPDPGLTSLEDQVLLVQLEHWAAKLLDALPERDACLLRSRFGLQGYAVRTVEELAEEFGVVSSTVIAEFERLMRRLRDNIETDLRDFIVGLS